MDRGGLPPPGQSGEPVEPEPIHPEVVRTPRDTRPGWKAALVVLGGGLLSVASFAFSEYLQARGIVSVDLARIFLLVCWVALVILVVITTMALRIKHRAVTITAAIAVVSTALIGLELWADRQPFPKEAIDVRIEPERGILSSIGDDKTIGQFTLDVHNAGQLEIEGQSLLEEHLLVDTLASSFTSLARMSHPLPRLEKGARHNQTVIFNGTLNAAGDMQAMIVLRLTAYFRADGAEHEVSRLYGLGGDQGEFLYGEGSSLDVGGEVLEKRRRIPLSIVKTILSTPAAKESEPPKPPVFLYPSVTTNFFPNRTAPTDIRFGFIVRDSKGSNPNRPLHNVRLQVTTPLLSAESQNGWRNCLLARREVAAWSNTDPLRGDWRMSDFGLLKLTQTFTLLDIAAGDDTGDWKIMLIVSLADGIPATRRVIDGQLFETSQGVHFDEASDGFPETERNIPITRTAELFRRFGVPVVPANKIAETCPRLN